MVFLPRYSTAKARLRLKRVNEKVEPRSTFTDVYARLSALQLFHLCRTHVNITRQRKSTLTETFKAIELRLKDAQEGLFHLFKITAHSAQSLPMLLIN